jgi:hypothetical protein
MIIPDLETVESIFLKYKTVFPKSESITAIENQMEMARPYFESK